MAAPCRIYVDADGCPVKREACRVAARHGIGVTFVSNSRMHLPHADGVETIVVKGGIDAADDWIADHAGGNDIVVTGDIPLADRCLRKGAFVLDHRGGLFTQDNIGVMLASRDLMARLREMGGVTRGPEPFGARDRSRFLHRLDEIIGKCRKQPGARARPRDAH